MIFTVTLNPSLDRTLTVPRISFGGALRATASRWDWGGKGFNVSRALAALGAQSVAVGFAGGATGQQLAQGLESLGITTDLVKTAGETRSNVVVAEAGSGRYVKVNELGPTAQPDEVEALLDRVRARVGPGDLWILSGSLPPGLVPDFYAQLVQLVQARGGRALLDAGGEPLRLGCGAGPILIKPNAAEAEELAGFEIRAEVDALAAAQYFCGLGVGSVALSLGAGGLLLASAGQAVRARPPQVEAQNPVGAGDALLAGIAWALARDLPLEEVARWGVAAGTAAAMRPGVGVGTLAEVRVLHKEVQIEIL